MKSCNTFSITDCKIANGVKYCYCAGNLCNGDAKVSIPITTTADDEDSDQSIEDGSGSLDWEQFEKIKYPPGRVTNTTTAIQNNTPKEKGNDLFTKASAVKLFLSRIVYVISLIFIISKLV